MVLDSLPNLVDAGPVQCAAGQNGGRPVGTGRQQEMQGRLIFLLGHLGAQDVITVCLIDDNGIGHLQHTFFDPLQFITGTCNHQNQKEVDH